MKKFLKEGEFYGLPFAIWENESFGHLCGYVQVPPNSRLYGKGYCIYSESENGLSKLEQAINDISVHGGLTYSGDLKKDGGWWFGFDCGHCGDLCKNMTVHREGDIYRDEDFVTTECESLAQQLKEIIDSKI